MTFLLLNIILTEHQSLTSVQSNEAPKDRELNKRELQKEETVSDILSISENLFRKIGYEKTTIQTIADHCGLSKGALYYHFKSKEEVLEQISLNHYRNALQMFLPITRDSEKTVMERIRLIMESARQSQMNTAVSTFVKSDGDHNDSIDNAVMEKVFSRYGEKIYREIFTPLLEEGRSNGEFDFPGSAQVMAGFIHQLDSGMTLQLNEILSHPHDSAAAEAIQDIIDGFSYALSQLLHIQKFRIDEITLAGEMLRQYRQILSDRRSNG